MEIRPYLKKDEVQLFDMMREEGAEWECYYGETVMERYKQALANSITYVAFQGDILCGYVRSKNDNGLGIYIYDLLVRKPYRGHDIGRRLMEFVCTNYPEATVYVMSGVDEYYKTLGYHRAGSIFKVHIG